MEEPGSASVADRFVAFWKMRREEAASQGNGTSIFGKVALFILCEQILSIFVHDLPEAGGVFLLENHQGAIVGEAL